MGNVLIDCDNFSKLCDFGFSVQLQSRDERRNSFCGTPNYIAPEIVMKKTHSFKVDSWSFGCLLYLFEVGKTPFEKFDVKGTIKSIKKCDFDAKKIEKSFFKTIILKCLEKDERKRFSSEEILTELKKLRIRGNKIKNFELKVISPKKEEGMIVEIEKKSKNGVWADLYEEDKKLSNDTARTTSATLARSEKIKMKNRKFSRNPKKSKREQLMKKKPKILTMENPLSKFINIIASKKLDDLSQSKENEKKSKPGFNFKARSKTQTELFFRNNYFKKDEEEDQIEFPKKSQQGKQNPKNMTLNYFSKQKKSENFNLKNFYFKHNSKLDSENDKQFTGFMTELSSDKLFSFSRRRIHSKIMSNYLEKSDKKKDTHQDSSRNFSQTKSKILSGKFGQKELQTLLNKAKSGGKKKEVKGKSYDKIEIKRILGFSNPREKGKSKIENRKNSRTVDKIFLQENFFNSKDWTSKQKSPSSRNFQRKNFNKRKLGNNFNLTQQDFLKTYHFGSKSTSKLCKTVLSKEKKISNFLRKEPKKRSKSMKSLMKEELKPFKISEKVKPIKMEIKIGKMEIRENLSIKIFLKKGNLEFEVSKNGTLVTVKNGEKGINCKYELQDLPKKYKKHYKYAKKIVEILNKKASKNENINLKKRSHSHVNIGNLTQKIKMEQKIAQSARNLSLHTKNFSKMLNNKKLNLASRKKTKSSINFDFDKFLYHLKDKFGFFGLRKDKRFEAVFDNGVQFTFSPKLDFFYYSSSSGGDKKKVLIKGKDFQKNIPRKLKNLLKIALKRRANIIKNMK